jgi:pimeloyl-ACP methyl ester carboxylesterase
MPFPSMPLRDINGVELEIGDSGSGEPVVFVHGGMGDECFAVIQEPALIDRYRLIHYHRRGWGKSSSAGLPLNIQQQAYDCSLVMKHVGIERAHCAGLSYGGTILLQMAVDFPEVVHSLALMEPALPSVLATYPEQRAATEQAVALYASGDRPAAIDVAFQEMCGAGYRAAFDLTLPPGWFDRWMEDSETLFHYDLPELQSWKFAAEHAARISQPVLNMTGANTKTYFQEIHKTVQSWLPHAESVVLPNATHAMLEMNPKDAAEYLADFFSRHPLHG